MGSDTTTFKLDGLDELIKKLESLPEDALVKMERKVLRSGLRKVMADAMSKVPVKTGNLKSHFKIRIKKDKKKGQLFGQLVNTANHAHLIEFGHVHIGHEPRKKVLGVVSAKPFMRPALAQNTEGLIRESQTAFETAFEKFARKNR